ncbi:MAG: long-chain-fatty-acid--CoA ligase [Prochloraceae cyanobacterium]|nr:long-chain-fatty-acid--CoA ligase [Prochloraceae cyanobacterium]
MPIGRPFANTQIYILDSHLQPVPIGVIGELYIGGIGLARGYLNRSQLSEEKFIPNPFDVRSQGGRPVADSAASGAEVSKKLLYKTGDLARYLPDGNIEFLGRMDNQVKIRGYRIELGEIEAATATHPQIKEVVAIALEDRTDNKYIVAYIVRRSESLTIREVRNFLKQKLPDYMIPSFFVMLEALPLTPNGKIDRHILPAPDIEENRQVEFIPPRNDTEEAIASIFISVLKLKRVGIHDNFFELGGHSLLATQVISRLQQTFKIEFPLRALLESPTVAELSQTSTQIDSVQASLTPLPTIIPDPERRDLPFPLTDIQQAYWLGRNEAFELGNIAAHGYIELESNNVDLEKLNLAWQKLIDRHDMLRAVILPDGQQQILKGVAPYQIQVLDLRKEPEAEIQTRLESIRDRMSHEVLPADRWPLFEIRATRIDEVHTRLHLSFDGLIADAWSMFVLGREWSQLYENPDCLLPRLELSFRDYVLAESKLPDTPQYKRSREYWLDRLDSLPPGPELPLAKNPGSIIEPKFKRRSSIVPAKQWQQIKERANQVNLTPSGVLLNAFAVILGKWSKTQKFTINLTLFNRLLLHPQVNDLVGDFTSLTLLEVDNSVGNTFVERANRLQQQLWEDLDRVYFSAVRVQRELNRRRESYQIVPVVFTSTLGLDSLGKEIWMLDRLGKEVYSISQTPQVWLDHQVREKNGSLVFNWDAVEEIFPEGLLDDMFAAYCNLLDSLATSESVWVENSLQLLPSAQLSQRHEVNNTVAPISQQTLHGLFIERVKTQPQCIAVVAPQCTLTYEELYRRANRLGHHLQQLGATPNTLVAVAMEKGWEQVVAVLGILISGAAYLPIDPNLPQQRQKYLLEQGKVKLVVTQFFLEDRLSLPPGVQNISVSEELVSSPQTPLNRGNNRDLAYVIYTSGSTGKPKGVAIDHRGAVNTILDINNKFNVAEGDRILALSALNFDLSVYDIFGILAAGGSIVIPPSDGLKDPAIWLDLIVSKGITLWNTVPALMQMLVEYICVQPKTELLSLRLALLSGDWLPLSLPEQIQNYCCDLEVVSLGGATEASIWSIYYPVNEVNPKWKSIPYGKPLLNQSFYVLNELMENCPIWVAGNLYIGGIGLALGYWQDEEKTNASFITHPVTGERLYKTGDLGRYLPDGNIEFLGREDFQVKINGYRIELGEIEATLKQHSVIQNAVVTSVGEDRAKKSLIAYVIPKAEKTIENFSELRRFLRAKLPEYMVPAVFTILKSLPLTNNGKIERQSLPLPDLTRPELEKTFVAPRNKTEELLTSLWKEVFKLEKIGIHDDFFELGGHSFLALQLIAKIEGKLDTKISLNLLFQHPTVAEIADRIANNTEASATFKYLVPIQEKGNKPPLFCIHPAGGQVMVYRHLSDCLGSERPILGLQSHALDDPDREHQSIDRMAVEYTQEIRQYQPQGPYYLMGWSMGGLIAVSIAKELEKQGQKVSFVGVIDSYLISENGSNFERDPLMELALVLGGTFVDAFTSLDGREQENLRKRLINISSSERLQKIMSWGQEKNLLSTNISIEILEKQLRLTEIHDRLIKVHHSPIIKAPIYSWSALDRLETELSRTDWSKYTTNKSYEQVLDGNHFSIVRPPYINILARELETEISKIYLDEISTLADLSSIQALKFPDSKALIFENKTLTYLQLDRQSNRIANLLLAKKIKPQSRVAILAKDSLKSYEILFACCKINAVFVPINWRLAAAEVSYILRDANVELLFVGSQFEGLVKSIENEIDNVKTIITLEKNDNDRNWLNYDLWYREYSDDRPNIIVEPNDIAVQMYTSGTTGRPKGVQLANYSLFAIAKEFAKQGKNWIDWNQKDKSLITLPCFHIGGLWWAIRGLLSGAENILLATFSDIKVLEAIEKYRVTKTCMVPAMIQVILSEPKSKKTDFSSLEYIVYGGSPIAESLLKKAIETFSCKFVQIYGMTETGNCAVCLPAEQHTSTNSERLKSAGKPFPGVKIVIVDREGKEVDIGQIGEIKIKSPANTIGYWNLLEATAKTLVDGWIYTGDAGYFDEEGYIYICDRIKDMICCAGENIYPAEIENILYEHPAVSEVAVIGVPDEYFGEIVKAIVVLKDSIESTAFDLIDFLRGKIADFKLPRSVEFTDFLPRTPSGKLQKGKLREKYWQNYQRKVN